MQQKLLRNVVFLGILLVTSGIVLTGCIDEPTIPAPPAMETYVRFINAIPGGPAIDVWIDGTQIATGKASKQATSYLKIGSGDHQMKILQSGSSTELFNAKVSLLSLTQQSFVIYDDAVNPKVLQTIERYTYSDEGKALADSNRAAVKFIHVIKGMGAVQLRVDALTGPAILSGPLGTTHKPSKDGFGYGAPSQYTMPPVYSLTAGTYNFYPATVAGLEVLLPPNFPNNSFQQKVDKGVRYTFVFMGTSVDADVLVLTDDQLPS